MSSPKARADILALAERIEGLAISDAKRFSATGADYSKAWSCIAARFQVVAALRSTASADRSPKGGDAQQGSIEDESATRQGDAQ